MIKTKQTEITRCIIHKVGNKYNSGKNVYSENIIKFDEESYDLLIPFLLKPFKSLTQSYRFIKPIDFNSLNKISHEKIESDSEFINKSKLIAQHLYEQSNSAQIKKGDVLIVEFENIEYNNVYCSALGVFKIENKSNFFQTYQDVDSVDIAVVKGISTNKLDKGCLILDYSETNGEVVLSVDNNNYDAQYWIKNFLNVEYSNDNNLQTKNYIQLCDEFSKQVLNPELGKKEQSIFLNNTIDYLKDNDSLNIDNFKEVVFEEEKQKEMFKDFKEHFEKLNDVLILNSFDISNEVVKKEKSKLKQEIKLDTNIKISIDVDSPDAPSEYLELGYDDEKKMKYYKVYFNDEK